LTLPQHLSGCVKLPKKKLIKSPTRDSHPATSTTLYQTTHKEVSKTALEQGRWMTILEDLKPIEFSVKSPCLHPIFGPPFNPYPLFE